MSKWRNEAGYTIRYALAGILNSLVGFTAIWGFSKLGAAPVVANLLGYATGLCIGFFTSKKFVFRSAGHFNSEAIRYIGAFCFSYLVNLAVLYSCMAWGTIDILVAQGIAVSSYVISMYLVSRLLVFACKQKSGEEKEIILKKKRVKSKHKGTYAASRSVKKTNVNRSIRKPRALNLKQ